MADEAQQVTTPTRFRRYTVADANAIAKGTVLALTDPKTAAASSADNDVFAGIAMEEKVANDGKVEIGAALDGDWLLKASAAGITVGADVVIAGANTVKNCTTLDDEKGYAVGKALETTAGSETILVSLRGP
jgi:hypothetical protein